MTGPHMGPICPTCGKRGRRVPIRKRKVEPVETPVKAVSTKAQRDAEMCEMRLSGHSLEAVAAVYGITRERVRQITDRAGIGRVALGKSADLADATTIKRLNRYMRAFVHYGLTPKEVAKIQKQYPSATRQYSRHEFNSKRRGIAFEMTFSEWLGIWLASGKYDKRGRGAGYCMARWQDEGPYAPWNVYICTIGKNFADSYIKTPWHVRFNKAPKLYELDGVSMTVDDWAEKMGIPSGTLYARMERGWSVEKALTTPLVMNNSATKRLQGAA